MNPQPPDQVIAWAVRQARLSPCQKTRRGAVVYNPDNALLPMQLWPIGLGYNGPPESPLRPFFSCDGSAKCMEHCGKRCEHAEGRAVRNAIANGSKQGRGLALVHAKIDDDGKLVAGGGPSCWQCSRTIFDSGIIDQIWLFEEEPECQCEEHEPVCDYCSWPGPSWVCYSAEAFHRITLINNGVL